MCDFHQKYSLNTCTYHDHGCLQEAKDYFCPSDSEQNACIFHFSDSNKDSREFEFELNHLLSNHNSEVIDFIGFVFPKDFPRDFFKEKTFEKPVVFHSATFMCDIDFSGTKFKENVDFTAARFMGHAFFVDAEFSGTASFYRAQFYLNAAFRKTIFHDSVQFAGAWFQNHVLFNRISIGPEVASSPQNTQDFEPILYFNDIVADHPERISFQNLDKQDINRISFLKTNVTFIAFTNIPWFLWPSKKEFLIIERRRICDERFLASDIKQRYLWRRRMTRDELGKLALLEELYRQLRKNNENSGNFGEAGEFHFGEMEMRRKQRTLKDMDFYAITLYKLFGLYGENWFFSLLGLLVIILSPSLYYLHSKSLWVFTPNTINTTHGNFSQFSGTWNPVDTFGEALLYSFKVIILQRSSDYFPMGFASTVSTLQAFLGLFVGALFILAVKRNLKR